MRRNPLFGLILLYSPAHRLVLYDLPDPSRVLALIPEAKRLANGQTAVPLTLRNSQILRHIGMDAMSPIEVEYDYPSRYPKPRPNQLVMSAFKTLYPRNIDTSEMRCVDCETEYLSPTGWRRIDQYDGGMVAQYDIKTCTAEFVQPEAYHVSDCQRMLRFRTHSSVDQKLSPGHRMLYVHKSHKNVWSWRV